MIGDVIDHYRVLELIGRGAMGVVYKALDVNLDRLVAIKVMSAEARSAPDFVERFRQEARLQGALNHPNVALLFDYFVHDGAPIAVMEYICGESLAQWVQRRGPIPAEEAIPIFKQALQGVAAAHRAGIIHRDLKPPNLMITRDYIVKVMDFGIAKRQGVTGATKASTCIGSPLYMAPEQILGRTVDCRTDVYALGLTLYEILTGQPPFNPSGKAEFMVLNAHVNDLPEPPTVHCREIPQSIEDAVMRSLAKDPDARFQSVDEFMRALPDDPNAIAQQLDSSGIVVLEHSLPSSGDGVAVCESRARVLEPPLPSRSDPHRSLPSTPAPAVQESLAQPRDRTRLLRADRPVVAAALVATLVLGALVYQARRLHPPPPDVPSSGAEPAAASPADIATATALAPMATPLAATTAPAQKDLSGTWRGEYVDASGKQLLRVVSLSIDHVHDDGGIEGTLRYEATSGEGVCKLHPRGSTYSAGEQRLQLSPEGCSLHYPKELGVPLDFYGVNPRANALREGRIEAPTGQVIRVSLKRVSGV